MKNSRIESLITLLKDDDNSIVITAMHELLQYGENSKEVNSVLSDLQESNDGDLRKKVHQLQAIQRTRSRRRVLSNRFKNRSTSLLQGLADLNVIWYDEFGGKEISNIWRQLIQDVSKNKCRTVKKIADFMLKSKYAVCNDNFQDADLFCLGAVIEDKIGSDILLASIALEVGQSFGLQGSIVYLKKGFGILFSTNPRETQPSGNYYGEILIPVQNWEVVKPESELPFEIWSNNRVLKYITGMLFANSVYSESPRYIKILGSSLLGQDENDDLSEILPYPFGGERLVK